MNDISKCANENCKIKDKCYRYTCTLSHMQSYAEFEPYKDDRCIWFVEIPNGNKTLKNTKNINK